MLEGERKGKKDVIYKNNFQLQADKKLSICHQEVISFSFVFTCHVDKDEKCYIEISLRGTPLSGAELCC